MTVQNKNSTAMLSGYKSLAYPVSEAWKKAIGMLKGRKHADPLSYQHTSRKKWAIRSRRYRLGSRVSS